MNQSSISLCVAAVALVLAFALGCAGFFVGASGAFAPARPHAAAPAAVISRCGRPSLVVLELTNHAVIATWSELRASPALDYAFTAAPRVTHRDMGCSDAG